MARIRWVPGHLWHAARHPSQHSRRNERQGEQTEHGEHIEVAGDGNSGENAEEIVVEGAAR